MALISAHRCNDAAAIAAALDLGVDFVEFDVLMDGAGRFVLAHDRADVGRDPDSLIALDEALCAIRGRAGAHVDLKLNDVSDPAGADIAAVERVLTYLDVADVVVTSSDDRSVARLVQWAVRHRSGLRVGLSTASPFLGERTWDRRRSRWRSAWPRRRMRLSAATVVAARHDLADRGLARWARRRGTPLLVWTVDDDADLRRWVQDPWVWLITTNRPDVALAMREQQAQ